MGLNNLSENTNTKTQPIITLDGFIQRQNEIQKQVEAGVIKGGQHMLFLEKLLDFQKVLIIFYGKLIDPIEYIHNLYFKEHQSYDSISKTITSIFEKHNTTQEIFKSGSSLQKFVRERLHWEARDSTTSKDTFRYKSRAQKELLAASTLEKVNQRKAEFLSWFLKNSNPNIKDLDQDIFMSFGFKYKKLIYIVANVFHISKDDFLSLQEIGLGNQSLADRFNEQFQLHNINFEVSHKDIARAFEKFNSQN